MKNNTKKWFAILLAFVPGLIRAEDASSYSEHFNPAMIISWMFVLLIILFTLVIYILGKVLIASTKEKIKSNARKGLKFIALPLLTAPFLSNAQAVASGETGGLGFGTSWNFWYLLIAVLIIQLIVIITFALIIRNNLKTEEDKVVKTNRALGFLTSGKWWDRFNKAKDLKEEKSILLDHDYDGIQELDNDLPPWWKYGFYLTILWAVAYLFYYHVSDKGMSSKEEYENEMAMAEREVAAFKASQKLNVDETTAVVMTAKSDLDAGASIYAKNCVACHMADGGGGIGPNLTDQHWIYGGSVKNLFKTIKYGANNGMKSWSDDLSPIEMQQVSSFILSLQGTSPADPKGPEGELFSAEGGETDAKVDSELPDSTSIIAPAE